MKRKIIALSGAVGLLLGLVAGPSAAQPTPPQTLNIEVGALLQGAPAESMRFLAPELNVHAGDVLNFTGGFKTATAIPANEDPAAWIGENAGFGDPFALQIADPDEGLTNLKYNPGVLFPNAANCGVVAAGAPPCEYTGDDTLNSGALFFVTDPQTGAGGFSMEISANPGDTFYLIDLIHPAITLKVNVVPPNDVATTQADIDAFRTTTLAADTQTATSLHREYANKRQIRRLSGGRRLHHAWAGVEVPGVALFDMYPLTLNLRKGDKVRWHFEQLIYEIHTTTIPRTEANEIASEDFQAVCDPDGDQGSQPDTAASFDPTTGQPSCPVGSALEIDSTPRLLIPEGDGRWTGRTDVEHSAVRASFLPSPPTQGSAPFNVTFAALTGDRALKYACAVHPFMVGNIKVMPRRR